MLLAGSGSLWIGDLWSSEVSTGLDLEEGSKAAAVDLKRSLVEIVIVILGLLDFT